MLLGDEAFGSIRIGLSTVLMRQELNAALRPALITAAVALGVAVFVAALLAQLLLRPIHVLRSGLTRLGKGEFGVKLDLPQDDEFGELGTFFNTVSQQLSADRTQLAGQKASLAVGGRTSRGRGGALQPAGRAALQQPRDAACAARIGRLRGSGSVPARSSLPHDRRRDARSAEVARPGAGPLPAVRHGGGGRGGSDEFLVMTHAIESTDSGLVGILLVSRNLAYLSRVQSTIAYSRKLVALGRLTAGIAHEVKNPLNAMMIHLELLRTKIKSGVLSALPQPVVASGVGLGLGGAEQASDPAVQGSLQHVEVIESAVRRLDEVVQGFLKFTRPEDLQLQPVSIGALFDEILPLIEPEAQANYVKVTVDAPMTLPNVNGDAAMLRQAFLNLAINGCQAMPHGGTLRLVAAPASRDKVEVRVEDTGVGIPPDRLGKIFDLYYTTKDRGTGIGLSMVYRSIQMHDGELEVQSTPGRGTTFRILLPRASEI